MVRSFKRLPRVAFAIASSRPRRACARCLLCTGLVCQGTAWAAAEPGAIPNVADLSQLSIEQLADIEISSVSRRPERLSDAAAAIYVITREDIRRSGADTLPEILRLAPNLQVARINASSYAISSRGFNNSSANKLLVMIDGRSIYTPLHSGVFWDVQDVMPEDIERIEVVSGPGGTLWGANAVNGVINIITRSARDTIGSTGHATVGNQERGVAARGGWNAGPDTAMRAYARVQRFDATQRANGSTAPDEWDRRQAGFRADGKTASAAWTAQGDIYGGTQRQAARPDATVSGGNLLMRWNREMNDGSGLQVQAYVDSTRRRNPGLFSEDLDTFDIDTQHRFAIGGRHELVWGAGIRSYDDHTTGNGAFAFAPQDSRLLLWNAFGQDTVTLSSRTKLTLGMKAEHNSYTGLEFQPNVRLAYKPDEQSLWWTAVSRAVRTPSRLDRDFTVFVNLPAPYNGPLLGGKGFDAERLTSIEAGYRAQPHERFSYSVSAFVNRYDRLRSVEPSGGGYVLGNGVQGRSFGVETWGTYQATSNWRLSAGLNLLHERLAFTSGSGDPGRAAAGAEDPSHQFTLRSSWSLPHGVSADLAVRDVGTLSASRVPAYTAVDARVAWAIRPRVELSLAAFNLFDPQHVEFGSGPLRSEVPRELALRLSWAL